MDNSGLEKLKNLCREIIDPAKDMINIIQHAQALRDLLEQRTNFSPDTGHDIGEGEARLANGLAISPALAAMCLRELFRTPAFIRGLHEAIRDSIRPGQPVRVLYAGCGPYALLALPLMTIFTREQVTFTLLDIHQECLDKAMALIDLFGLSDRVEESLCVDATLYRIAEDRKPDVIVSETMAVCLRNEPQVSIARNLLTQSPEAILVPQSVSVELCMMHWASEHIMMPSDYVGKFPPPRRDRIGLGNIFELDAANIRSWEGMANDRLPAGSATIPVLPDNHYAPALLTTIAVYGKNFLRDYDCSLTMPQHLPGRPVFSGGENLQFSYVLGTYPKLVYEVLSR